jgi:hypothetical protein
LKEQLQDINADKSNGDEVGKVRNNNPSSHSGKTNSTKNNSSERISDKSEEMTSQEIIVSVSQLEGKFAEMQKEFEKRNDEFRHFIIA